jgi:hypothetical protein
LVGCTALPYAPSLWTKSLWRFQSISPHERREPGRAIARRKDSSYKRQTLPLYRECMSSIVRMYLRRGGMRGTVAGLPPIMEIYVSKAIRHCHKDRGSRLGGTTFMVVPPDVSNSTVHCWSGEARYSSCMSMYSRDQILDFNLGSTTSPKRLPSVDEITFSGSPGVLITDRLTAC